MRLYTAPLAPNALRVVMLMREKQIDIPLVNVDLSSPEKKAAFRAINPLAQVPALELDNGTYLTESLTICQYLDAVSGAPYLFGESVEQRAHIAMWERRAEMSLFIPAVEYGHHTHPSLRDSFQQIPQWATTLLPKFDAFYNLMAQQLATHSYLAGEAFSMADITAYIGSRVASYFGIKAPDAVAFRAWSDRIGARESVKNLFQIPGG